MNKSAPLLPILGLLGAVCFCLLAFFRDGRAQSPEPVAASVEAPAADENKAADTDLTTKIFATQGATFTAKDRIAIFMGDVRVNAPHRTVACDKLTVYLARSAAPGPAATPPPVETPAKTDDEATGDLDLGSGIDHGQAEGHVIIIQKKPPTKPGEKEKVSIGYADIAEFDNKTGDMTLRGMPKVEQNGNVHEALSRSTWMVLHKDDNLETHGPNRTTILPPPKKPKGPGGTPGNDSAASPLPSASPAGRRPPAGGTPH